jgi:hypothetical protein
VADAYIQRGPPFTQPHLLVSANWYFACLVAESNLRWLFASAQFVICDTASSGHRWQISGLSYYGCRSRCQLTARLCALLLECNAAIKKHGAEHWSRDSIQCNKLKSTKTRNCTHPSSLAESKGDAEIFHCGGNKRFKKNWFLLAWKGSTRNENVVSLFILWLCLCVCGLPCRFAVASDWSVVHWGEVQQITLLY